MPQLETASRPAMLLPVDDPADPRISAYTQLRERDLAGRGGRFVAEGEVVLRVLLSGARFAVESVLVSARRAARLASLLARLPDGVPVYVAAQAVMDGIVGFHIHRGVLAIGLRGPDEAPEALLASFADRALVLGLVGISNHDNVGGIFRNAAAFGAGAVLLDRACCDPLYRKAIRVSVGASLIVPFARVDTGRDMLQVLREAGFAPVALTPRGTEPLAALVAAPMPDRIALLLGAEGPGLPDDVLAHARTVRIPMAAGFDSLNVATASGIALHQFAAAFVDRCG